MIGIDRLPRAHPTTAHGDPLVKTFRILVIVALTAGLLALWLRSVNLRAMGHSLMTASPAWIGVIVLASVAHLLVRSWRWQVVLGRGVASATFADLVRYTVIGYAISFMAPGRTGEVVRPALLWRRAGTPFGRAMGSVVFERFVLDLATLGLFLFLFTLAEPQRLPEGWRVRALVVLAAGLAGLIGLAIVARRHRGAAERVGRALARKLPVRAHEPVTHFVVTLLDGLEDAFRKGRMLPIAALSVATWTPVLVASWAGLRAVGVDVPLTTPLLLVPMTAIGIAVPTPAGVGGYHAALTWSLATLFGVGADLAAACAVVTHAASVIPIILLGLYASWREGLSLSALRRQASATPEERAP